MNDLFFEQSDRLRHCHFLLLYWAAQAEIKGVRYNITNAFDDLKDLSITRTKQSAVSYLETLDALRFLDLREENNRKNIYITSHGEKALEYMVRKKRFKALKSRFLEVSK